MSSCHGKKEHTILMKPHKSSCDDQELTQACAASNTDLLSIFYHTQLDTMWHSGCMHAHTRNGEREIISIPLQWHLMSFLLKLSHNYCHRLTVSKTPDETIHAQIKRNLSNVVEMPQLFRFSMYHFGQQLFCNFLYKSVTEFVRKNA